MNCVLQTTDFKLCTANCRLQAVISKEQGMQYFTLLHEFQRILPESHGMLEFHSDSTGMVGISNSCAFHWIPSGIPGNSHGFPVEFEWNSLI